MADFTADRALLKPEGISLEQAASLLVLLQEGSLFMCRSESDQSISTIAASFGPIVRNRIQPRPIG